MAIDAEKEMLLAELAELKRSNERLERAFLAISALVEERFSIQGNISSDAPKGAKRDALSLEFKRKLKRNRPALIKEKILEQASQKENLLLSDLKFYIVDQMNYTSKASFYRYVSELEKENRIGRTSANNNIFITVPKEILIKNNE